MQVLRRDLLGFTATFTLAAKNIPTRYAKVETVFRSPGPHPNGLQATADGLWILDQGDNHAYLVAYDSGKVLRDLKTGSVAGSGITFDGEALWLASTYSSEILRADAAPARRSNDTTLPAPEWSPGPSPKHAVARSQNRHLRLLCQCHPPLARRPERTVSNGRMAGSGSPCRPPKNSIA